MIFLVASICIQIICAVDVVRSGRNQIWMLFIFLFSLAGCFAYLMLEVLPAYWGNRHLRTARSQVVGKVDPERGLRKARADLDLAETAANRIALGDALLAGVTITDEASALEWMGRAPRLIEGRGDNLKVTRPEDLLSLARLWQAES